MTKTLTEQLRYGTLPEGYYYVLYADQGDHYPSCDTEDYDDVDYWNGCEWHYDDDPVIKVLAAVPDYEEYQRLVSNSDESSRKALQLEKKLEIATKALEQYANSPTGSKYRLTGITACIALKEMEGVK